MFIGQWVAVSFWFYVSFAHSAIHLLVQYCVRLIFMSVLTICTACSMLSKFGPKYVNGVNPSSWFWLSASDAYAHSQQNGVVYAMCSNLQ